jgi:hypothetical protein
VRFSAQSGGATCLRAALLRKCVLCPQRQSCCALERAELLLADWIRAIGRAIVISRTKSWQEDDEDKGEKTEKKKS